MSTSETDDFEVGPCPCGKGRLIKTITTYDNPWSSAIIRNKIDCAPCSGAWRVDDYRLTLISSEAESNQALQQRQKAYAPLKAAAEAIVMDYFKRFGAPTKKAEHAELVRLGITSLNYRGYLDARKGGRPLHDAASPLGNKTWLLEEAARQARGLQLASLLAAADTAEDVWKESLNKIIRKKFD